MKKKLKQTKKNASAHLVQSKYKIRENSPMEPERLWRIGFVNCEVKHTSFGLVTSLRGVASRTCFCNLSLSHDLSINIRALCVWGGGRNIPCPIRLIAYISLLFTSHAQRLKPLKQDTDATTHCIPAGQSNIDCKLLPCYHYS